MKDTKLIGMHKVKITKESTGIQMAIATMMIILVGLIAMGAWFAKSDTLLGSLIQSGLAWCF